MKWGSYKISRGMEVMMIRSNWCWYNVGGIGFGSCGSLEGVCFL